VGCSNEETEETLKRLYTLQAKVSAHLHAKTQGPTLPMKSSLKHQCLVYSHRSLEPAILAERRLVKYRPK
jgi:hypothetical protein